MGNCGGKRRPSPKNPDMNPCGRYELNDNGRGYTKKNIPRETRSVNAHDYCIGIGNPTPVSPEAFLFVGDVIMVASVFAGPLAPEAFAAGAALAMAGAGGEAIDKLITNIKYKEGLKKAQKYCESIGDSVVNSQGTLETMWTGQSGVTRECGNGEKIKIKRGEDPGLIPTKEADWWTNACDLSEVFFNPGACKAAGDGYSTYMNYGCCDGDCSRDGTIPKCMKNDVFSGNPFVCCLLDYRVNGEGDLNPESCYEDSVTKQRTCDPYYRDLAAPTCQDVVAPYCLGEKNVPEVNNYLQLWLPDSEINLTSFLEVNNEKINTPWRQIDGNYSTAGGLIPGNPSTVSERTSLIKEKKTTKAPCLNAIARSIYKGTLIKNWEDIVKLDLKRSNINSQGLIWAKRLINDLYDKYTKDYGSFIGTINSKGTYGVTKTIQFKKILGTICGKFPFLCEDFLKKSCSTITSDQFIYLEPDAKSWCGCYMQDKEYEKYSNLTVPKECTPTCNIENAIPLVDTNYVPKVCKNTICIIDNLSVDLTNASGPTVDFNQLCRSCGGANQTHQTKERMSRDRLQENRYMITSTSGPKPNIDIINDPSPDIVIINNYKFNIKRSGEYFVIKDFSLYEIGKYDEIFLTNAVCLLFLQGAIVQIAGQDDDKDKLEINVEKTLVIGPYYKDDNWEPPEDLTKVTVVKGILELDPDMSVYDDIGGDSSVIESNTCTCIFADGDIDLSGSKFSSFNLYETCGVSRCYNDKKEVIPCTTSDVKSEIINTLENSLKNFKTEMNENKNSFYFFILTTLFTLFSLIFLRFFKDDVNKGTKIFSYGLLLILFITVILTAQKIVKNENSDLSKNF